jgi:uncharacterized protein (DUF2345 family)
MIQGAETRLDGDTLVVRIPMRFQRRGARKRIVGPDGSEIAPTTKPQPDSPLVKALAGPTPMRILRTRRASCWAAHHPRRRRARYTSRASG